MTLPATPGRSPCCGRRRKAEQQDRAPEAVPPGRGFVLDADSSGLRTGQIRSCLPSPGRRPEARGQSRSSQAMSQKEASYREQAVKISSSSRSWVSV